MDLNVPSLMIGTSIISEMHEYFEEGGSDDREHIISLSFVIRGIAAYLKSQGISEQEADKILSELKDYGKKLWIDFCLESSVEDESETNIRKESDYLFDYIFEKHEFPY